jgi:hypothetical protein
MVDLPTLRALALDLPQARDDSGRAGPNFSVEGKSFVWPYLARATPRGRREPVAGVLAVRCALETKAMLVEAAPDRFFDDDHYRGYPAVLVRLALIEADELAGLLRTGWRLAAPKALARRYGV